MAVIPIKISEKGRQRILIVLILLNIIQIVLGFGLFVVGINVTFITSTYLDSFDKYRFGRIFDTLFTYGFLVIFNNAMGLNVCYNCASPTTHINCGRNLAMWLSIGFITSILGLVFASLGCSSATTLTQQLKISMQRGMGQYLTDPAWKKTFDKLQQELECCGTLSYMDWHHTSWISIDHFNDNSLTVMHYAHADGHVILPVVPWSCCNPDTRLPCFHDMLQLPRALKITSEHHQYVLDSLFTEGCLHLIQSSYEIGLNIAVVITAFIFLLQLIITIMARYLFIASRNSIILGNPGMTSYGWFIGCDKFAMRSSKDARKLRNIIPSQKKEKVIQEKRKTKSKEEKKKTKPREEKKKTKLKDEKKETNLKEEKLPEIIKNSSTETTIDEPEMTTSRNQHKQKTEEVDKEKKKSNPHLVKEKIVSFEKLLKIELDKKQPKNVEKLSRITENNLSESSNEPDPSNCRNKNKKQIENLNKEKRKSSQKSKKKKKFETVWDIEKNDNLTSAEEPILLSYRALY